MTAPNAELAARIDAAVRAERAALIGQLGHDAVLWLALVPLWTKGAAEAVGFPARPVTEFVQRARDAGWCETRGSLRDGGGPGFRFWMPGELRRDVLDHLRRYTGAAANEISARVLRLRADGRNVVPGALAAWAGLLAAGSADRALIESVSQSVEAQDLGRAQDYISAGEALADLFQGTMEVAVDRARRLLSLGRRRRMDARDLERYLDRPELSDAVERLLAGGTGQWALHLRGVGGVGKTMLIRYLAAGRYAADRGREPIPIARVDFDYMSPDYPVRRPVQLLLELDDELSLHTASAGAADYALARFRATAATAHEALSGARAARGPVMRDERVLGAISDFADSLRRLPQVLLILDTCEELAKTGGRPEAAPAVTTTFQILERIHEHAPNVRVLFAGRRPLPAHDYLAIQPVGGFTASEARQYLTAVARPAVRDDLADAIIRQSPALDDPDRVSPFDLALYRSWADEDPGLTVAQVERGSDAYVEGRIIERLGDADVIQALPALAMAGRFRVATIAEFLDVDPAAIGPRLAEQEWIDADGDPPAHVSARPALARRLRRYFSAPDRAGAFAAQSARLAAALRTRIRDAPVPKIDRDEVLAALRLSAPGDAASLWDDLAVRAKDAREWDWLLSVTNRVRGEWEEEEWPTTAALRATVTAAHIAASRRAYPSFDAQAAWREVLDSAGAHPERAAAGRLRTRAAAGLLPYATDDEALWETLHAGDADPELAAALADLAHRLLEAGDDDAAARVLDGRSPAILRAETRSLVTSAASWWLVAQARLRSGAGHPATAELLSQAEQFALDSLDTDEEFFDWIQPDDLLARVRVEYGLIAPPGDDTLAEWEDYAAGHFGSIDAERLASQCLRLRLSRRVADRSVIDRWAAIDRYEHAWQPACSAHEAVPPLFASLAAAMFSVGDVQRALDLLDRRRNASLDTRSDETTIRQADAETIRVARRLRLESQSALITRLARAGDGDAVQALAVIYGEKPRYRPPGNREPLPGPAFRDRSDWLWPDARVLMRRAVRAGEPYSPPREMPGRLFAEMAFDEAELLQDDGQADGAARMFGYARDAYTACGDRIGEVLALASLIAITGDPGDRAALDSAALDRAALDSAIDGLRATKPAIARALTGAPDRAGPWRYWTAALAGSPPRPATPPASFAAPGPATVSAQVAPRPATWQRVLDPVARRYVGVLPLKFLNFLAVPAGTGLFHLWPRLRWPRPKPKQPLLRRFGYVGRWESSPGEPPTITWEFDPPAASGKWWSRGTASGVIDLPHADDAALPWERMLSESLGPGAAGRVSWYRRMEVNIRLPDLMPGLLFEEGGVRFIASDQWQNLLPFAERRVGNAICYAIGQATSTSAGPRLDLGRRAAGGAPELMGSAQFASSEPGLIVLQAPPVADESELFAGDDLPEKLELAVDLINAGAVPAVLIVPAIPAALAGDVAGVIKQHAARGASAGYTLVKIVRRRLRKEFLPDPRALRKKLRKTLAPHVPPALLDDLVLFVNEGARRD